MEVVRIAEPVFPRLVQYQSLPCVGEGVRIFYRLIHRC